MTRHGRGGRLRVDRDTVVRLWLARQGLSLSRGHSTISKKRLSDHLVRTGGLQLDPINVLDRAHYLTLWSRFGAYDRRRVDGWVYRDRVGYEYWGHEASILPASSLPLGLRPDAWLSSSALESAHARSMPHRQRPSVACSGGSEKEDLWRVANSSDSQPRVVEERVREA